MDFAADVEQHPFDPWQRWTTIHAGELLPSGRERFRYVLIIVARQNGKSEIPVILVPYWMFVEKVGQILTTSTKVNMAKKMWAKSRKIIEDSGLDALMGRKWFRETNGEVDMWTPSKTAAGAPWDSHYAIDASNEEGGRSLSVNRLVLDELRQHHDYSAWGASVRTMGAMDDAQAWLLSNAGSDRSVVLNGLRDAVVTTVNGVETVINDPDADLFLAEWSSPADADPEDVHALAQSNPNMNRRGQKSKDLLADARRAVAAGGEALTEFRTEVMCIRVKVDNPALDAAAWARTAVPDAPIAEKSRWAVCLDFSLDGRHAALVAACRLPGDRYRVQVLDSGPAAEVWGRRLTKVGAVNAVKGAWYPHGPAAAYNANLKERDGVKSWLPRGVELAEIAGAEVPAACMGFADMVAHGQVEHLIGDDLLDEQVPAVEKRMRVDTWVFERKGDGYANAVYAAAGAVQLARTLPEPVKFRLIGRS